MSTWNVRVADADQYRITFAGVPISRGAGQSGYADGEFLSIEQVQESFKAVEGTDGTVVRSKTNSRLVNINVSLIETSTSNAYFSSMITLDEGGVNGAGIGSFAVQDLQGTTLVLCTRAWVMKRAPISKDRTAKERKWPLQGVFDVFTVGGN